ncbi:MAG TPA: S8 family serine peptidase [Terriglobales bacterium]|nr:S8 family serine peptidase [Terriglobales bacterium]
MKRFLWLFILIFVTAAAKPAAADTRVIVRDTLGSVAMNIACSLLGCNVQRGLGDPGGQLFLVTFPDPLDPALSIAQLLTLPGITAVEIDQVVNVQGGATATAPPPALYDNAPMDYYGTTVRHGYVYQPANQIIRTLETQSQFGTAGAGIVAVIDTGVDTTHPVLQPVVVPGYDFVHNTNNADEKGDIDQSTEAVLDSDSGQPCRVNQSTEAVLDQSTEAVLDGNPAYAAFGHGTMISGVVHLVAPQAQIMPLKAFRADGTGYASDVLRAIYYAASHNAKVINMSFSFAQPSPELKNAIDYATNRGLVSVAAAGNDGLQTTVYPAGLKNVMGIASTDNYDVRSSFSNYGSSLVWVAAPGEGVVTVYPFGHYAAAWGTSFSTPFVSGTSSLLVGVSPIVNASIAQSAISHAKSVNDPGLHYGRLDTYQAVQNWWLAVAQCSLLCPVNSVNYRSNTLSLSLSLH